MALNTFKCNCLTPLHFKGLKDHQLNSPACDPLAHLQEKWHNTLNSRLCQLWRHDIMPRRPPPSYATDLKCLYANVHHCSLRVLPPSVRATSAQATHRLMHAYDDFQKAKCVETYNLGPVSYTHLTLPTKRIV